MREIKYTVSLDGVSPSNVQFGGMQGEHNATRLNVTIGSELFAKLEGAGYRFEAEDGAGCRQTIVMSEVVSENIVCPIPQSVTSNGGNVTIRLIFSKVSETEIEYILYSFPMKLRFDLTSNGEFTENKEASELSAAVSLAKDYAEQAKKFVGKDGTPATHSWNGTVLTVTSGSGTTSADLKGEKGDSYILTDADKHEIIELLEIDNCLDSESTNPVQNKAVTEAVSEIFQELERQVTLDYVQSSCVTAVFVQEFDDEQKQIARDNIDAASQTDLKDLDDQINGLAELIDENFAATSESLSNLNARTTALEENLVLPPIYIDERNAVLDKVQSEDADLRLVTFTDTHDFSANKYKKYGDLMASGCIDGLVGLGDYQIYSNDITKTETIRKITELFRYSGRNPNCIYAVGNHDVAYISANSGAPDQSKVLTKKELHDCFNRHLNGSVHFNDADPYGCYYYTDFDASKIRMIVLNTSDIYEPSGILKYKYKESVMIQQPQISWLVNNALDFSDKSNPTEWSVIVCQHAYFDASVGMISDILSAVKNGTSLNKSWTFKRIVDNPDTTEPINLLPIELAEESYSAVGITITHDNGTFTVNGTATTSKSFEIVTKGNDYGQLKAGVKYKIALNKISGTATNLPPLIVLRTRKADGTEAAYQNYATGDDFTFTLTEDETLIRFAIAVGAKDYGYTDFVCQPSLTAVEGISDESQIETVISANKDFSEQGAVDVIAVLYGHDHVNTQSVTKGINFIEFISDSAFVDDYYNVSVSGLTAGGYYITNSNGIKMGFTVGSDLPEAVTIGYNNYHAKYNASAPIRVQNGDGATIFSRTAKPSNYQDGMTEITGFIQERTPNTVKTESCSVVSINKDTRTIKIVPYGTGIYREITY